MAKKMDIEMGTCLACIISAILVFRFQVLVLSMSLEREHTLGVMRHFSKFCLS